MKSSCAPYQGCTMKGGKRTKSHKIPGSNFDFYLSSKLQKGKRGAIWINVMDGYIYLSGTDRMVLGFETNEQKDSIIHRLFLMTTDKL